MKKSNNNETLEDKEGITPLYYWLMHAVKEGNFERFQRVFEDSKEKNPQNKNGWSVLHEAAKRGCHDMVHVMLNNTVICYKLPAKIS